MNDSSEQRTRLVKAVHGAKEVKKDPHFEVGLSAYLQTQYDRSGLIEMYRRFAIGDGDFECLMRRVIWRSAARRFGDSIHIGSGVGFKHIETFEIGDSVFIGTQTYIQGRFDGRCIIGNHVWIGPQSYFDARDLIIEDFVGWGPGAKVLGSTHTGLPVNVPIIQTDLHIKPVKIEAWADVGTNATILPGVTIGRGSIIGAGAVVDKDVPAFAVAAGIPAKIIRWRKNPEDT
jgi:acetyltransferase-like isoleucine patch superfamily enzyme